MTLRKQPPRNRLVRALAEPPRPPIRARVAARLRPIVPYSIAVGIAALLGASVYGGWRYLMASPRFELRELRWSTLRHVSPESLAARLPFSVGENLLRIDLDAAARALAADPWVESARLRRRLPGAIVVDVREREPAAALLLDELYLTDRDGRIFKRASLAEADGLVVISGLDREQALDEPVTTAAAIRRALALADAWSAGGRPAISEIALDPSVGATLFLRTGGAEVRLGQGDLAARLKLYDTIALDLAQRGESARAILLDSTKRPDRVAVRLERNPEGG
jgi:cell division protein FtsQ